jgi:transcriptional regulator with XRE-family HTH domain
MTEARRRRPGEDRVPERIGENLRRIRNREGLSQEQLAWRASLHRTEIGLLENGKRVPRIDTLMQLAGALGVPAEELLDGIYWVPGTAIGGEFDFDAPGDPKVWLGDEREDEIPDDDASSE